MKAPIEHVDFGRTAADYLAYRAGFPDSLFSRLSGLVTGGCQAVDLGTGTGTLGRGLAKLGASVIGIDPSESMLEMARQADRSAGISTLYRQGSAERTGLADGSCDLVAVGQAWHWFDAGAACDEIRRILRPGGRILVAYYDWLPLPGNVVRCTEELIESHNPAWRGGNLQGIHTGVFRDLGENGFTGLESFSYDEPAVYSHEAWRGRIRASAGVAATLDQPAVLAFDQDLRQMLQTRFPADPIEVPHRVFALTARLARD